MHTEDFIASSPGSSHFFTLKSWEEPGDKAKDFTIFSPDMNFARLVTCSLLL